MNKTIKLNNKNIIINNNKIIFNKTKLVRIYKINLIRNKYNNNRIKINKYMQYAHNVDVILYQLINNLNNNQFNSKYNNNKYSNKILLKNKIYHNNIINIVREQEEIVIKDHYQKVNLNIFGMIYNNVKIKYSNIQKHFVKILYLQLNNL